MNAKLDPLSPYHQTILQGLSRKSSQSVYQGTVPAAVVDRRRAAGKTARRSRAINRKRG